MPARSRDWSVPASGKGYVTHFRVAREFLDRYAVEGAGGRSHLGYGFQPRTFRRSMPR
jgi:hypothetical protein